MMPHTRAKRLSATCLAFQISERYLANARGGASFTMHSALGHHHSTPGRTADNAVHHVPRLATATTVANAASAAEMSNGHRSHSRGKDHSRPRASPKRSGQDIGKPPGNPTGTEIPAGRCQQTARRRSPNSPRHVGALHSPSLPCRQLASSTPNPAITHTRLHQER
ncbi:hypothetical protein VOLCADRAFT_87368 [Volvox carteri f. nagariensis]|uniref:Uncharacterized protein n=1 Tax=Volvox carteri f. nagariensis TaxID=3068 RepID=D8TL61_VOLCA|nr:uncharacterized protein VOLCADRAFT_87368 [Volvox carteri f. nagariensis]EFJ51813.1 hypothetical protein VOLCADRAFT_87368 [Volvox carteri f. nagariensis]|eukprot:XP_002947223.1 hypothetical protein VOLCADRAFT_87368 [Volvox carteri f. nagariensis]